MPDLGWLVDTGGLLVMFALLIWQQERIFSRVVSMLEKKNEREFERWKQIVTILGKDNIE